MDTTSNTKPPMVKPRPFQFRLNHQLLAVVISGVAFTVLLPVFRALDGASQEQRCETNLKEIALGIQAYHDVYDSFPAASITDVTDKPAHSWRVAIAQFLNSSALAKYDYSEPWNGPANSKLARFMPPLYRCPSAGDSPKEMTSYVAIVGLPTMWPGPDWPSRMADMVDGSSRTIMVVEIARSDIHWMEPRDLPIEELAQWLDPAHKPALLHSHQHGGITGGIVVFADGHTEFLPHDIAQDRLRQMLFRADRLKRDNADY
jgi:hypothetical protein